MVDTGLETLTAGRILKARNYIGEEPFLLTYGDGVSNVDIQKLVQFHREQKKAVTISTMQPEGRFGALKLDDSGSRVLGFKEKARADQAWVNIGFMVMEPTVYDYLGDGSTMLEAEPFEKLAADGQLAAYRHEGFWSPMDNIHDREYLEKLWSTGQAPWKYESVREKYQAV
jgi:glucose-1-phosphate cytidylyltransferase